MCLINFKHMADLISVGFIGLTSYATANELIVVLCDLFYN